MSTLKLFPYQKDHVSILMEQLEKRPFTMDLSMLGTGKTYTTSQIALNLKLKHIIVIAPVSVLPKWDYMRETYGIPVSATLSFCGLRSVKGKQPKHGYLLREDYQDTYKKNGQEFTVDKTRFMPSKKYLRMVKEGVLLVMDEVQNIKNLSSQFEAACALMNPITESKKSKAILLSGSPIDKEVQAVHLFRCLGILKSTELCDYNVGNRTYDYRGVEEIETYCRSLTSEPLPRKWFYNHKSCVAYCYELFQKVFVPNCSHAMPPPTLDVKLSKYNGFYEIDKESKGQLLKGIEELGKACRYNPEQKTIAYGGNTTQTFTMITKALMAIEDAKMNTFIRLTKEELRSSPNRKVVVCLNYTENIYRLKDELERLNIKPLLLQGCMTRKQRDTCISQFQQKNNKYRVLISNLTVCSTGIDLDDKDGSYPRTCFISPMFNTITLYQLGHRFQRMDTRSNAEIYMVYGDGMIEDNIMAALMRKGKVMKDTVTEQADAGVEFPGDYPDFYEKDM
jgi:hypothetical protein